MAPLVTALFVLLAASAASAGPDGKCKGPPAFQKIQACCDAPMTLKHEAFDTCMPKRPMNSSDLGSSPPPRPSPYQEMCLFECVLKSLNMWTESTKRINYNVLTPAFLKAVNSTWAARTRLAINACTSVTAKTNIKNVPAPPAGEKLCDPKPSVFMTCFRQNMLLQCAASRGSACDASEVEKLRSATPMNIIMNTGSA